MNLSRLTERQCGRLLAELSGLDMCVGAGLGDVRILYQRLAKSGFITYDDLSKLYRYVEVRVMLRRREVVAYPGCRLLMERRRRHLLSQSASANATPSGRTHQSSVSHAAASVNKLGSRQLSLRQAQQIAPGEKGSTRFIELLKGLSHQPNHADRSASFSGVPLSPARRPATAVAFSAESKSIFKSWPSTSIPNPAALMAARDPPVVLRETIPLPLCDFPQILTKIKGIKELMLNSENKLCITALIDLYQEWEQAVEEKKVTRKRSLSYLMRLNMTGISRPLFADEGAHAQERGCR